MPSQQHLTGFLFALVLLLLLGLTAVLAQESANGKLKKKAENQLISVDLSELLSGAGYEEEAELLQDATYNVASFEDNGNTCYILFSMRNVYEASGFACVK